MLQPRVTLSVTGELAPSIVAGLYTVPMPDDSRIPGRNAEEMALNGSVLSTVQDGGPGHTELRTCIFGYVGEFPYRAVPSAADRPNFGHSRPPKSEGRRTHP